MSVPASHPSAAEYATALRVDAAALAAVTPEPSGLEADAAAAARGLFAAMRPDPASFPSVAMQILELVRYPDVDLNELARYIRVDGALAGGVLALANSAAQRAVRKIDTVKDAVARLGISEVARVSAAISMKSLYSPDASDGHRRFAALFSRLFLHAATTARCASELAKAKVAPTPGAETVFMAGLLHDVGKGVALRCLSQLVGFGKLPATLDDATAARVLHHVHVPIGASVHAAWKLPETLAVAAAHHHAPDAAPEAERATVHLVRLVSSLDLLRREPETHPGAPAEVVASARALGILPERLALVPAELDAAEAWVRTVFPA